MKNKTLVILGVLFLTLNMVNPSFVKGSTETVKTDGSEWIKTWGTSRDEAGGISYMSDNYLYVTGIVFISDINTDTFLAKFDLDGNLIWNVTWGGPANDLCGSIYGNGNYIYILVDTETPISGYDMALIKFDLDGNLIWNVTWGGPGADFDNSLYSDGSYLYALASTSSFGAGNFDVALIKFDLDGNLIWNVTWGGSNRDMYGSIYGDGSYLYALADTSSFGSGNFDVALIKFDLDGNLIWNVTWGGSGSEMCGSLYGDGSYLYASASTSSFGAGNFDVALIKFDLDGNLIWNVTWGGSGSEMGYGLCSDGNYLYVSGITRGLVSGDDIALIKFDLNGSVVWDKAWGGLGRDFVSGIFCHGSYLYVTGYTDSFGAGACDIYLIKLANSEKSILDESDGLFIGGISLAITIIVVGVIAYKKRR